VIEEFANIARQVHASDDFKGTLARLITSAEQAIGDCEAAGIRLLTTGRPVTHGATTPSPTRETRSSTRKVKVPAWTPPCASSG
jgi:hypothetical protein